MQTFLFTFAVFAIVVLLMAVGVLFGRKPIKGGGCGDFEKLGVECAAGCQKPCFKRRTRNVLNKLKGGQ